MALTVTTDLTVLTTAETVTGWVAIGAQSPALEPDFFVQGSNCISRAVSGAGTDKGMVWDNTTAINFTSGADKDKLVYIWMRCNTGHLVQTRANGGVKVRLGTSTTVFREWYVDGSDSLPDTDGWICYVIDPQSAGSATTGAYDPASVRYFGGSIITTTTAKGQNFGIDQISIGRGELYVSGTVTVAGEGFKEIAAVAYDAAGTNRWGIITTKSGIIYVKGKIILGHASSATTFSSRGETVVWETPAYKDATNVVKTIPDASVGGTAGADGKTTYNGIAFRGGSGATTIDIGVLVGTDSGRSGSTLSCAQNAGLTTPGKTLATVTASDDTMSLSLYSTTFAGFEGQIDLTGTGISGDDCYACTFSGCGRIDSNMEIRNINVLNSAVTSTTDGALIWTSTTNLQKGVFANNGRAIVFESTTGTPFTFTNITFGGNTFDVRNETGGAITINVIGGTTPSVENSAGSSTTLIINPVTALVKVVDATATAIQNARVLVTAASGGPFPSGASVTITRSGSTATVTHTAHGMDTNDKVVIKGADQVEYNGVFSITKIDNNSYSYTVSGTPATPATGSITSTFAVLSGLTDVNGEISMSRVFPSNQPVTGKSRKSTTAPLYQATSFSGTVNSSTGYSATVQMNSDE